MPVEDNSPKFCSQIIVEDGMARYVFYPVVDIKDTAKVSLKLAYLDTDDFSWSAYESSTTTREDIGMPDNVIEKALKELNSRIAII